MKVSFVFFFCFDNLKWEKISFFFVKVFMDCYWFELYRIKDYVGFKEKFFFYVESKVVFFLWFLEFLYLKNIW